MPLERNTVRSIENFSTGFRGSRTCELLLEAGQNVIFFHRTGSKLPFMREFSATLNVDFDRLKEVY